MANYLPVLLVSLSTNALNTIPDDSALITVPRAQVDYLSHDWQEEDVWRSWRNMTRQKNAIANGVRLENASWRTWWKQRNKLRTVSPETLNWLKDSDVTWLYGPLHTAAEWKPPTPRHLPSLSCSPLAGAPARPNSPSSTHPSRRPSPYKPILKHRSISELLTSELPVTSAMFSPIESEDESEADVNNGDAAKPKRPALLHTKSDTHITRWGSSRAFRKDSPPRIDRPGIEHEEHAKITCPKLIRSGSSQRVSAGGPVRASLSQDSNSSGKSNSSGEHSRSRHKKKHISFNTFVEQCIAIDKPKKNASGYFGAIPEAVWMGDRVIGHDDEGYEEDKEDSEEESKVYFHDSHWIGEDLIHAGAQAIRDDSDSPGDEEDEGEDDDIIEMRSISSRSTLTLRPGKKSRSQSKASTASSSSSASTSTSRTTSSRSNASEYSVTDNTSPSGSLSPSRRTSSSSNILGKSPSTLDASHLYSRSSTSISISTYRPSFQRTPRPPLLRSIFDSGSSSRSHHVTIAPIAPTLLKTTPTPWTENFGDDGAGSSDDTFSGWAWGVGAKVGGKENMDQDGGTQRRRSWSSGCEVDSYGFASGAFGTGRDVRGMGYESPFNASNSNDDGHGSDGTPVELVYVPPYEYEFSDHDVGEGMVLTQQERGDEESAEIELVEDIKEPADRPLYHQLPVNGSAVRQLSDSALVAINPGTKLDGPQVPTVVVGEGTTSFSHRGQSRQADEDDVEEESSYDYFGGPDMGDDYYYYTRRGGRGYDYSAGSDVSYNRASKPSSRTSYVFDDRQRARVKERKTEGNGQERQSRSRSLSHSRTPSPALTSSVNGGQSPEANPDGVTISARQRNSSGSSPSMNGVLSSSTRTPSNSDLLSPIGRGRQPDPSYGARPISTSQDERRGRSSTRNSSSSWDRERGSSGSFGSSTSPIGSLSPDEIGSSGSGRTSTAVGTILGGVLGGGRADQERDKERDKGRESQRRGRERMNPRLLAAATTKLPSGPSGNAKEEVKNSKDTEAGFISTASSSSSSTSSTVVPKQSSADEEEDPELIHTHCAKEATRTPTPTPSNSPVMAMKISSLDLSSSSHINTPTQSVISGKGVSIIGGGTTFSPSDTLDGMPPLPPSLLSSVSTISPPRPALKFRPPSTLIPAPSAPAKPSTSFTAVVSPTTCSTAVTGTADADSTIVGKAVDIVSSAGMYLGWWSREKSASTPSSPSSS